MSRRALLAQALSLPLACASRQPPFPTTPDTFVLQLPPTTMISLAGARLHFMRDEGAPLVSMAVALRAGHAYEARGHEGMAAVVARVLMERAQPFVHERGGVVSRLSSHTLLGVTTTVVREHAGETLRGLTELLRTLALPDEAVNRAVRQQGLALRLARGELEDVTGLALVHGEFGTQPASATVGMGSGAGLGAKLEDRASAWLAAHVRLDGLVIAIAGALEDGAVDALFERVTASWSVASGTPPSPATGSRRPPARRVFVPWLRERGMVAMGALRTTMDPDAGVSHVADTVVVSVLHHELRTRLRVTYGATGRMCATKHGDLQQVSWEVGSDDVARVAQRVSEVSSVLESWQCSLELCELVRRRGLVKFMAGFQGAPQILQRLLDLASVDHDVRTFELQLERLRAMTPDTLGAAVRAAYPPDATCMAIVADARVSATLDPSWEGAIHCDADELFGLSPIRAAGHAEASLGR